MKRWNEYTLKEATDVFQFTDVDYFQQDSWNNEHEYYIVFGDTTFLKKLYNGIVKHENVCNIHRNYGYYEKSRFNMKREYALEFKYDIYYETYEVSVLKQDVAYNIIIDKLFEEKEEKEEV